ncbi:MAG: transcription antitermination factor NusB [Acidobacteria bacterium]|nr:transcription antitermination factor NusB [Acidobacteriota bacterium]
MASRRKARECALQMLFQWDIGRGEPQTIQELFWSEKGRPADESLRAFANDLFAGTVGALPEIDGRIRAHAEHWRLERMPVVDRNILRLGIFELCHHSETPPAVVINEALEITRKFSEEEAVQFINGLLDRVHQELEAREDNNDRRKVTPGK